MGSLFAVAIFLFSFKGYNIWDNVTSNIAAAFALLTAIFPTSLDIGSCQQAVPFSANIPYRENFHIGFAAVFLLALAFMSLFLFTKSNVEWKEQNPMKKIRNLIYICSGLAIVLSLVFLLIVFLLESKSTFSFHPNTILIFEEVSLLAFGLSWFTKSGYLFKDKQAELTHDRK